MITIPIPIHTPDARDGPIFDLFPFQRLPVFFHLGHVTGYDKLIVISSPITLQRDFDIFWNKMMTGRWVIYEERDSSQIWNSPKCRALSVALARGERPTLSCKTCIPRGLYNK